MVHSRPPSTRVYLIGSAAMLSLVLLLGTAIVLYGQDAAAPQAAVEVTRDPRTLPRPTTPATICERHAVQMLSRYALATKTGQNTDLLIGQEQQYYGLNSLAFIAYKSVLNEFVTDLSDPANRDAGVAAIITKVMPVVRRVCAQAA
jgi:hypothetical protein